ncbi:hypothetical protein OC835_007441, partial [Tilletia horrida]
MPSEQDAVERLARFKLLHDPAHDALLCATCKTAVDPTRLREHFQRATHGASFYMPVKASAPNRGTEPLKAGVDISTHWSDVKRCVGAIAGLLPPSKLAPLPSDGPPHAHLAKRAGFLCSCGNIEVDRRLAASHLQANADHAFRSVCVQSWMERGGWFVVGDSAAGPLPPDATHVRAVRSEQANLLDEEIKKRARAADLDPNTLAPLNPTPGADGPLYNPWLRRTRWVELLEGVDLAAAAGLLSTPAPALQAAELTRKGRERLGHREADQLASTLKRVVAEAIETAFDDLELHGSPDIRDKLHSDEVNVSRGTARPLTASRKYVRQCADNVAEMAKLGWVLFLLKEADAVTSGLTPLLRCIDSILKPLAKAHRYLVGGTFARTHAASLVFQVLKQRPYGAGSNSLARTYSGLRGIDTASGHAFKPPGAHSGFLSRIIFGLRLGIWLAAITTYPRDGLPAAQVDANQAEIEATADQIRVDYAVVGVNSVLASFYNERNYSKASGNGPSDLWRIIWAQDRQSLSINGEVVRMEDVRAMAAASCKEVHDLGLALERHGGRDPPPFDTRQLRDVPGQRTVGYSAVTDPHNAGILASLDTLEERLAPLLLRPGEDGDKVFTKDQHGKEWALDEEVALSLLREEQRYLRALFFALYWTSSPANRGSELKTIQIINTVERVRDVLVGPDGALLISTAHSKTDYKAVFFDKVTRVPPPLVGTSSERYQFSSRRFYDKLRFALFGEPRPSLLFVGTRGKGWPDDAPGDIVRAGTARLGLGVVLGLSGSRHLQSALTIELMERLYLMRFLSVSSKSKGAGSEEEPFEDGDEVDGSGDPFFADLDMLGASLHQAANHTVQTAQTHYQDDRALRKGLNMDRQVAAITASAAWHRILGLPTFVDAPQPRHVLPKLQQGGETMAGASTSRAAGANRAAGPTRDGEPSSSLPLQSAAVPAETLLMLVRLFNSVIRCKSRGQARALNRITRTKDTFLAALPPGAGKSALWQVAALLASRKGRLIVVLLPLLALLQDAERAAAEVGLVAFTDVKGLEGEAEEVPEGTDVVLMSLDFALGVRGSTLIHSLAAADRLDRICIDEVHILYHDTWRTTLLSGWKLNLTGTPLLLLSATVPPSREADLARALLLDELAVVRESVQQPNLYWTVLEIDDPSRTSRLGSIDHRINEVAVFYASKAKKDGLPTIVFGLERQQVRVLAAAIDCGYYHS